MNEQTIQNVIDALDKCTMQACIICPYNGRTACKFEMHRDAYETMVYLDGLRGKALEVIGSIIDNCGEYLDNEDIEEYDKG